MQVSQKAGSNGNEFGLNVTAIKPRAPCVRAPLVWGSIWAFPPHRRASLVVGVVGGSGGGEGAGWSTMTSARKQANAGRPQLRSAQWLVTCARRWFLGFCRPRRSAGGSAYCCRGAFFSTFPWYTDNGEEGGGEGGGERKRGKRGTRLDFFFLYKKRQKRQN